MCYDPGLSSSDSLVPNVGTGALIVYCLGFLLLRPLLCRANKPRTTEWMPFCVAAFDGDFVGNIANFVSYFAFVQTCKGAGAATILTVCQAVAFAYTAIHSCCCSVRPAPSPLAAGPTTPVSPPPAAQTAAFYCTPPSSMFIVVATFLVTTGTLTGAFVCEAGYIKEECAAASMYLFWANIALCGFLLVSFVWHFFCFGRGGVADNDTYLSNNDVEELRKSLLTNLRKLAKEAGKMTDVKDVDKIGDVDKLTLPDFDRLAPVDKRHMLHLFELCNENLSENGNDHEAVVDLLKKLEAHTWFFIRPRVVSQSLNGGTPSTRKGSFRYVLCFKRIKQPRSDHIKGSALDIVRQAELGPAGGALPAPAAPAALTPAATGSSSGIGGAGAASGTLLISGSHPHTRQPGTASQPQQ